MTKRNVTVIEAMKDGPRRFNAQAPSAIRTARLQFLSELQEMEQRAHDLKLQVTAHALNRAKNALGWEMAGNIEEASKASRDDRDEDKKRTTR